VLKKNVDLYEMEGSEDSEESLAQYNARMNELIGQEKEETLVYKGQIKALKMLSQPQLDIIQQTATHDPK